MVTKCRKVSNVVNPDVVIMLMGQTLRLFEMFLVHWRQLSHGVKRELKGSPLPAKYIASATNRKTYPRERN